MSKHNYSQYSKPKNDKKPVEYKKPEPEVTNTVDAQEKYTLQNQETFMPEVVETAEPSKTTKGTVVGCSKLNVREQPNATAIIITVISFGSEVEIDESKSNSTWLHVYTASGVEGYCMTQYINTRL